MSTSPRVALITGANRGIGYETAKQLAEQGIEVLVAARQLAAAEEAAAKLRGAGHAAQAIALDVTDEASIAAAAETIRTRYGRLDILVNNAGILVDTLGSKPSAQPLDTWRKTFDTNLFGVVAVTNALLPLIKAAPAGRIVNLSSILGSLTLHSTPGSPIYDFKVPAYNASKSALNSWTVHLAWELRDTPIKVNAAHPGYVKTDMNSGNGELDVPDGARTSVTLATLPADGPSGGYFHLGQTLPW